MNKAILVIDMPDECSDCPCFQFGVDNYCAVTGEVNYSCNNERPTSCPLKLVPEKMTGNDSIKYQWGDYEDGWNHCINILIDT